MKPRFEYCKKLADDILLMQQRPVLFNSTKTLKYDRRIVFDAFQNYEWLTYKILPMTIYNQNVGGGTVHVSNNKNTIVLYDGCEDNLRRLNWTLAHEVGHIYLGHSRNGDVEEVEANFFAAELLMPEIIVHQLLVARGYLTVDDVCCCFNVTHTAAQKRLDSIRQTKSITANPWLLEMYDEPIKRTAISLGGDEEFTMNADKIYMH